MKRHDDDNQVDAMLNKHLHCEPADFDIDKWAGKFPEEAKLAAAGFPSATWHPRTQLMQIWRYIMTSRYTRYAGVAVVVLVALSFLFPGGNGIIPESLAWADVQKALEEQTQVHVTGTRNCFLGDDETPTYKLGVEKLLSLSYGYTDRTYTEDGTLIIEFAFHLPSGTATVLFPTVKKYYRTEIPADRRDRFLQMTREDFFNWLWASGNYRQIGPKQVQGIEAVGFEVPDIVDRLLGLDGLGLNAKLVDFFLRFQSLSVRMWVDPERRLPIQVEGEGEIAPCLITGYRKMRLCEIDDSFDFDADLDESLFNPEIPEGFEPLAVPGVAKAGAVVSALAVAGIPAVVIVRRSRRHRAM
jgi:hypothetical protein